MNLELDITPIKVWLGAAEKPVIISGPCSAESERQMIDTAKAVAATGKAHILRAGIWKPRTRPSSFEGVGESGLKWLKKAGTVTGLPVATQVAKAQHVERCLAQGIDILWIGARTTANPFSVQEIADALKGVDIPVMVKNPITPDLQLWIGALERINQAGIKKIVAIHRGFSTYDQTDYRYSPKWDIPIGLKTLCPHLDIICDPSHISGNRELLPAVCQKALDLDMSGLMIESHITPDAALSDPQQQITPSALVHLLDSLTVREVESSSIEFSNKLEELRSMIDEIDKELLEKLMERIRIVEQIGEYKRDNNVTILQLERWKEILNTRIPNGKALGLDEEFIRKLLELTHKESIKLQTEIMNRELAR